MQKKISPKIYYISKYEILALQISLNPWMHNFFETTLHCRVNVPPTFSVVHILAHSERSAEEVHVCVLARSHDENTALQKRTACRGAVDSEWAKRTSTPFEPWRWSKPPAFSHTFSLCTTLEGVSCCRDPLRPLPSLCLRAISSFSLIS